MVQSRRTAGQADSPGTVDRWIAFAGTVGRLAAYASRKAGRGEGSVIGGKVMLRLAPGAVRRLSAGRRIVLVSGTNGKTTTSALLVAALGGPQRVASNQTGANMLPAMVTALAAVPDGDAVLECDEAYIPAVVEQTQPRAVLLLNLSRDQLDRYSEVRLIADRWRTGLPAVPVTVANADDPNVVWAAQAAQRQVWVAAGRWWDEDARSCPACGRLLEGQGARWWCSCGLRRPEPAWWVDDGVLFGPDGVECPLDLRLPGRFNQGNAALVAATACELGVPVDQALAAMRGVSTVADRYLETDVGGRCVRLLLAKNPAGWRETLGVVKPAPTPVVLAFNARVADGRDPSWLYDVPFGALAGRPVVVTGERMLDLAVRLRLDGVPAEEVPGGLRAALAALPPGEVDVIANYTAFQQARGELRHA